MSLYRLVRHLSISTATALPLLSRMHKGLLAAVKRLHRDTKLALPLVLRTRSNLEGRDVVAGVAGCLCLLFP